VSPWLIPTTSWPGLGFRVGLAVLRTVTQPWAVAAVAAVMALVGSVVLVRRSAS
jgi:hypothetical protein